MGSRSLETGGWRKGPWTPQEDNLLIHYVTNNGEGRWSSVSQCTGLNRSGKSCRLRWVNYLRPGLKKGHLTPQEQGIIIELHALWGNKWSTIARYLPGRTDNEIKNYWRTHFKNRKPACGIKQRTRKNIRQLKQGEFGTDRDQSNNSIDNIVDERNCSRKEDENMFPSMIENHQLLPMIYQETSASDFIPLDCYLWGGLWNLDNDWSTDKNQDNNVVDYYVQSSGGCVF